MLRPKTYKIFLQKTKQSCLKKMNCPWSIVVRIMSIVVRIIIITENFKNQVLNYMA